MKIKNKKPLGKCPKCGEIINLGLSKRWRQMRVEIDSLQEERKEAIKRAQNAIRMKHAQRYQFHKYIAQLYSLYTPEQKEKAKKISRELRERLKHIERKYSRMCEEKPHILEMKVYVPYTNQVMGEQRTGMSIPPMWELKRKEEELKIQNIIERINRIKAKIIKEPRGITIITNPGFEELLKILKPKTKEELKEKTSKQIPPMYIKKLFGDIDLYTRKEEIRLEKEIKQFYNGKCKCGAEETIKGMCQKCYAKDYREKNRQKVNTKMREAYKERAITIPTFGTKKGTHHVLLRKKDAPKKEQIKKEVKKITDKVFEEVIKNPRKFLDSINEN